MGAGHRAGATPALGKFSDVPQEVLSLRDEDGRDLWSGTAMPIRVSSAIYAARHGRATAAFRHNAHEIEVELLRCEPVADSIELSRLRLRNCSARVRHLSISAYVEWALGAHETVPAPFIVTTIDAATGALFAPNPWRCELASESRLSISAACRAHGLRTARSFSIVMTRLIGPPHLPIPRRCRARSAPASDSMRAASLARLCATQSVVACLEAKRKGRVLIEHNAGCNVRFRTDSAEHGA